MAFENPASILFDSKGDALAVSQSQALEVSGAQPAFMIAGSGSDGKVEFIKVADTGEMFVTGAFTLAGDVDQGAHGTPDQSWYMVITDGTSSAALGTSAAAPLFVTGTMALQGEPIEVTGSVRVFSDPNDPTHVTGSVGIIFNPNPTATVSSSAAITSATTLLPANVNRRGATFYYPGTKNLYLKLGSGAAISAGNYSVKLSAQAYYEVPANYTGIITGIWDSAAGANNYVQVTEVVD